LKNLHIRQPINKLCQGLALCLKEIHKKGFLFHRIISVEILENIFEIRITSYYVKMLPNAVTKKRTKIIHALTTKVLVN